MMHNYMRLALSIAFISINLHTLHSNTKIRCITSSKIPLKDILKELARMLKINIILIFPDDVMCPSIDFSGKPEQVIEKLCADRFYLEFTHDTLKVSDAIYSTSYHIGIPLDNHQAWLEFENTVKQITKQYSINKNAGIILASGHKVQHKQVQELISATEYSLAKTVKIEVTIINFTLNDKYKAGIILDDINEQLGIDITTSSNGISVKAGEIGLVCDILSKYGTVRTTSNIILSTSHNQTGSIQMTIGDVYFAIEDITIHSNKKDGITTIPQAKLHKLNTGTILNICPTILANNNVSLALNFENSWVSGKKANPILLTTASNNKSQYSQDIKDGSMIPLIDRQLIQTSISNLRPGQSILLGGLCTKRKIKEKSGIPFISWILPLHSYSKIKNEQIYVHLRILPMQKSESINN